MNAKERESECNREGTRSIANGSVNDGPGAGGEAGGRQRSFWLLDKRIRKAELALFCCLMMVLACMLLWAGFTFIVEQAAHPSVLPFTIRGTAAVILGCVYMLTGAGIMFSSFAMWRVFR